LFSRGYGPTNRELAQALGPVKRRAVEGGSYRIRISLARLSLWLLHMGIFDKAYATSVAGRSALGAATSRSSAK
jgi:hypothetical protein